MDVSLAEGKSSKVLVGIRADGTSIIAREMSKGTRFQLYLKLRVAVHAEFAKHREMLLFFADDILEPFDEKRSTQTFTLLRYYVAATPRCSCYIIAKNFETA